MCSSDLREDIERYRKRAFDDLRGKAAVPGFRPGRAPHKLVQSRFRQEVADQIKGSLLMDSLTQINEEHQLTAISEPSLDMEAVAIPDEGPMTFEFDLEVRPEFDLPNLALDTIAVALVDTDCTPVLP